MIAFLIIAGVIPAFVSANLAIYPCNLDSLEGGSVAKCSGHADVAPAALRIVGCTSMPCHVGHVMPNHGHSFSYQVDFDSHFASQTLTLRAFETSFGVERELNLADNVRNACNGLVGATCPVQMHQRLTHGANIEGEGEEHGGIPVQVRLEIYDDDHLCMCTLVNLIVH